MCTWEDAASESQSAQIVRNNLHNTKSLRTPVHACPSSERHVVLSSTTTRSHIPSAPAEPAKPAPPKQTSMRQDIDGMNLCSFALHLAFASSSLGLAQLLISGRFAWPTGILPPAKIKADASTPVTPMRARICSLSSSA